jgi:DNA-binding NarL/FixJ family response regulator
MTDILIVDDDATLAMELEEYLPTIGYQVMGVASSGSEAIKLARKFKPNLILMDIKMPGKLNGIQAAGIIKSELSISIIFISGYADEKLLEQAKLVEPLGYIHKPFSEEQIAAALKMACYQINRDSIWPKIPDEIPPAYKTFTVAEIRIAELLKQGKSTKEINILLNLSAATVIWHRKNIRKKLGISGTKEPIQRTLLSDRIKEEARIPPKNSP